MTILPKKKSSQSRSESESNTDGSPLQHLSVGSNNHLSHIGPVPQVKKKYFFFKYTPVKQPLEENMAGSFSACSN
jgi:hypothetical protein